MRLCQNNNFPDFVQKTTQNLSNTPQNNKENDSISSNQPGEASSETNQKKRTIEELFGDIDDILFETNTKRPKKSVENEDLELIEQILLMRKLSKQKNRLEITFERKTPNFVGNPANISDKIPNYPFIALNTSENQRVYVRFHSEEYQNEDIKDIIEKISDKSLLGVESKTIWEKATKIINSNLDGGKIDHCITETPVIDENKLWVGLYTPKSYKELLSEENINRVLLKWLKLWDKIVFKRRLKLKIIKTQEKFKKIDLKTDLDPDGRPYHKIALLCGPPGLGKTTLAHMVARQAGYNVIEINASDNRSVDYFKNTLETATQMHAFVDTQNRPNCLIFDEIDGAPSTSIDYLVKYATGGATVKNKKTQSVLKRPVICICNDVYTPALRSLRQVAFVLNFPNTLDLRLAERLMEICKKQSMKSDLGAMLALAKKANSDIRSCVSFLHFFKTNNQTVKLSDVHKANVGQKDAVKDLFSVWQDIFTVPEKNTPQNRMNKILQVVQSFGDYEKLAGGVFENYPLVHCKNGDLGATAQALEWFSYSDILNKFIYSTQNFSLSCYIPYAFVKWHFVFGARQWQKLQYPNVAYEVSNFESKRLPPFFHK